MKLALTGRWRDACFIASMMWVGLVIFTALWQYGSGQDRVRFWADVVEETINGDPTVETSAKTLRSRVGDERFIAEAQRAYPQVDLRDVLKRYRSDIGTRWHFSFPEGIALILLPPAALYVGLALGSAAAARNRAPRR